MTLDLSQLTMQLEEQLAHLNTQRTEIQTELDAILLVQRASQRTRSHRNKRQPHLHWNRHPVTPETAQPEEMPVPEETAPVEVTPIAPGATSPVAAAPEEVVPEPETVAKEVAAEQVVAAVQEAMAEPVVAAAVEEVAIIEESSPAEASSESTAEVKERRHQLEETFMALELNDEVAVLERLRMFQKPLSSGKIADELAAVHWNFQGQKPREAVDVALQKLAAEGKVQQLDGGDYGISI
jgi:hypothetical protein